MFEDSGLEINVMSIPDLLPTLRSDAWLSATDRVAIALTSYDVDQRLLSIPRVLWLSVDDVTNPKKKFAFTIEHAEEVIAHIRTNMENQTVREVICACDGGVSRSAALCASLRIGSGIDDTDMWRNAKYHPNELVYSKMREALKLPVSAGELEFKQNLNKEATLSKYRARKP